MADGLGHDQPKIMLIICFVPYSVVLNFWAKVLLEPGIKLFSSHLHTMTELKDPWVCRLTDQWLKLEIISVLSQNSRVRQSSYILNTKAPLSFSEIKSLLANSSPAHHHWTIASMNSPAPHHIQQLCRQ